ncbi:MAG: rodA, partial [Candidatus Magasanikbacteria bacterium]|nr:rodA [Candidatus Magasanikbacteria bacterium]
AVVIFLQMMVNIGAAIGIVPVTGLTLPFVSYGGSSLFFNYVLIAIAESIALRQGMVGKGTEVFA